MHARAWLVVLALSAPGAMSARPPAGPPPAVPPPPVARIDPVADTHFGETLVDPYRWMEDDRDPQWRPFLEAQDHRTRSVLDALPQRARLLERISALSGEMAVTVAVQRAGDRLYFEQRPAGSDNYKLFVREAGRTRLLVDPTALSTAGAGHMSLDWWVASPDGGHVAYGLSKDGSEDSVLHVLDAASGADLPERIADTEAAHPQWLDDGSGFFYTQLTGRVDTPERYLDGRARFHRLGTDPDSDPVLVQRGRAGGVDFDRIQVPSIETYSGSKLAVLALTDVRREMRLLVAPIDEVLAGKARWQPLCDFGDEVTDIEIDARRAAIYLLANQGHPRGRVLRLDAAAPALATAREVVAESELVIEHLALARDGLYLQVLDGGSSRLKRMDHEGRIAEIRLPFEATLGALETDAALDGALMNLTGWLQPSGVWQLDARGQLVDTGLNPAPGIDTSHYEAHRLYATARDGVRVPVTILYRKGLKRDGSAGAYVQAYGSYGISAYTPAFSPRVLALLDAGMIAGYAAVRGGGEYGREWHRAGQLANKPNTWRDLIDACETLVREKYTSPGHLAIGGRSAGGVTVGRALTERPDLFAAVVSGVGWSNPLRYVAEQNGYGEEPEWGAISDPDGYRYLKAIDSYHAVRDGTDYPAVLLTTGVTDPRVAPFHAGKMAARLQVATHSGRPVLLRVDFDAGHGLGSTRSQQDRETADTYAFLLWQTGTASRDAGR